MTEYALRLQNSQDTAARVRLGDLLGLTPAGALTARTGIRPAPTAGDVAVAAGTMNVTVQPFAAWVQGGVSIAQGGYPFVLDAAKTLALANGHASLSRTDVVAVVVKDDAYDGSGTYSASVQVVQGAPGAGVPALPTNCLPLRNVTVPANLSAGAGGLTAGNLSTDRRTYLSGLGGVVTVASQAERDALPGQDGTLVYRTDLDVFQGRAAGAWRTLEDQPPPHFKGSFLTSVSIILATAITFPVVEDTHGAWSGSSYTVPKDGIYRVAYGFKVTATPKAPVHKVQKNGAAVFYAPNMSSLAYGGASHLWEGRFAAGDTIELVCTQDPYTTQSDSPADNNYLLIDYLRP